MADLHSRFGRGRKERESRGGRIQCVLEVLETRALMSAMHGHAAAAVHAAHAAVVRGHHGHAAPTPIANLTGNPLTFSEVVGLPAVQNSALPAVQDIATITSSSIPPHLNGYSVSVDWGDGTAATRGFLFADRAGLIHVKGFHKYSAVGTFSVTITVTQNKPKPAAGATAPTLVIVSTANVTQNSTGGVTVTPTAGTAFSGVVGNFSLPAGDTTTDPATFKAFINWGDHHYSQGTVTLNSDGSYSVSGDHTYAAAGTFRISIFVVQLVPPVAATTSTTTGSTTMDHDCDFRHRRFIGVIFSTANVGAVTPV